MKRYSALGRLGINLLHQRLFQRATPVFQSYFIELATCERAKRFFNVLSTLLNVLLEIALSRLGRGAFRSKTVELPKKVESIHNPMLRSRISVKNDKSAGG